jgi:hypothetical protein
MTKILHSAATYMIESEGTGLEVVIADRLQSTVPLAVFSSLQYVPTKPPVQN